jgi:hypothetical protein
VRVDEAPFVIPFRIVEAAAGRLETLALLYPRPPALLAQRRVDGVARLVVLCDDAVNAIISCNGRDEAAGENDQ